MNFSIRSLFWILGIVNFILAIFIVFNTYQIDISSSNIKEIQNNTLLLKKEVVLYNNKISANVNNIYIVFFIAIFILFITILIVRLKIIIPIKSLSKLINLYEKGETQFEKRIYYNDEIGLLTKEFFNMKQSIDEKYRLIEQISINDELTNIYNRKYYNTKVSEILSNYKRYNTIFSVLMYDIDDFKKINDNYGHMIGDKVLIDMSQLVKSLLRSNDYLFRVGGEEFIVIFSSTNLEDSKFVAEKIRKNVSELNTLKNETITISIGLTEVKKNDTEDSIYQRVDNLLYNSKRNGKNKVSV